MNQPRGIQIQVVNEQASELLIQDLIRRALLEGASEVELIRLIKSRSLEVFGEEFDDETALFALRPVQLALQRLDGPETRNAPREEVPREPRSLLKGLYFVVSGISLTFRMKAIGACPEIADHLIGKYESINDGARYSIYDLLEALGGTEGLASDVVHRIEHIRTQRETDSAFLLDDKNMEFLRQVLFIITKLKINDSMFCDFGQGILKDLRVYVADYEKKKTA